MAQAEILTPQARVYAFFYVAFHDCVTSDMIKKRQMVLEAGDEGRTAAELFYSLAA